MRIGIISSPELQDGILSLSTLLDTPIPDNDVAKLVSFFDTDGNGSIDYDEFFDGFQLADPVLGELAKRDFRRVQRVKTHEIFNRRRSLSPDDLAAMDTDAAHS